LVDDINSAIAADDRHTAEILANALAALEGHTM
jgi:hypothetical protein